MTIGIIGYGDFGKFVHGLAMHHPDVDVRISSSRTAPDGATFFSLEDTCKADYVILAVPISAYEKTISEIVPFLGPTSVVCDVATVKKHTATLLREKNVSRFIATHPMFGPYSYDKQGKSLKGLRIAVCDSNLPEDERAAIVNGFKNAGLTVLEMTPDEHDRLVAETLFLTHLVGQIVKGGKFERTSIDTISFGFLMDAVESVAPDDALFRDVFKYNPYCKEVLSKFEVVEKEIVSALQKE
jgi:prephenate dehydrogenase